MQMECTHKVLQIAEALRREPFHLFSHTQNCVGKAFRFRKLCRLEGIETRVVISITLTQARLFGFWVTILCFHAWGEFEGRRIEVARPSGEVGHWGVVDMDEKPIFAIWL